MAMSQVWAVTFIATSMMAALVTAASSPKCVAADPTMWNFDGELTLEAGQTSGVKCLVDGVPSVELITCPETSSTEKHSQAIGHDISCESVNLGRMLAEASNDTNMTNTSTSTSTSSTTSSSTTSSSTTSSTTTTSSSTTSTMTSTSMPDNMTNTSDSSDSDSNMTTTTTSQRGGSAVSGACADSVLAVLGTAVLAFAMQ